MRLPLLPILCLLGLGIAQPSLAQSAPRSADLTSLSLEELMKVNVTSVARREQRLREVAAAIYVLTADDIRRSGARTIPDALRLVPGVQVAQIDANKWAVSARGFNGRFANKLLVLMDGRSIYTPIYSGVFWDVHNHLPEDIERIEVIRGPGAAMWGANAVNGVINIITRHARDTQGGLVTLGGGSAETGFGSARWGGRLGEHTWWRAGLQGVGRHALERVDEGPTPGSVLGGMFSLRADGERGRDSWHVNAGHVGTSSGESALRYAFTLPYRTPVDARTVGETSHALARWTRKLDSGGDVQIQTYASREETRHSQATTLAQIFDLELQHRFTWGDRHRIVWGGGVRVRDTALAGRDITFNEPERLSGVLSAFVQDEISLVPDELVLTLGSRFEHHAYSGFNVQPNARLSWSPSERHTLWASVARAVRTPSIGESSQPTGILDVATDAGTGLPLVFTPVVPKRTSSERVVAFEAGYRTQATEQINVDVAGFYNVYERLLSSSPGTPGFLFGPPPRIVVPLDTGYENTGRVYGAEISAEWRPFQGFRVRSAYSLLRMQIESGDPRTISDDSRRNPRHQGYLHASYDLGSQIKLDGVLRAATRLPSSTTTAVPGYVTFDARIAWQPTESLELALVGTNLVGGERLEFLPDLIGLVPTKVGPTAFLKASVRF